MGQSPCFKIPTEQIFNNPMGPREIPHFDGGKEKEICLENKHRATSQLPTHPLITTIDTPQKSTILLKPNLYSTE